jgi:transmembrane sensor
MTPLNPQTPRSRYNPGPESLPGDERAADADRREMILDLLGEIAEDPDMVELSAATTASIEQRRSRQRRGVHPHLRHRLGWGIAATLALGIFLWYLISSTHSLKAPLAVELYSTAPGEQRRIALADGSQVELNTATQIRVEFTDRARRLTLVQGEALFFVKHDTQRPFEVRAGATNTRAVGTTFDVMYLRDRPNATTNVAVLEGHVQVQASTGTLPAPQLDLLTGQATTYAANGGLSPAQSADLSRISSWQSQRVEFRDVTLSNAVDEFNRYTTIPIRISDPSLDNIRVSGVFRFNDMTAFTKALRATFGIDARFQGQEVDLVHGGHTNNQ